MSAISQLIEHLQAENERLRKALQNIAEQKTTDDNFEEYGDEFAGDYEEGYDAIIRIARAAVAAGECKPNA